MRELTSGVDLFLPQPLVKMVWVLEGPFKLFRLYVDDVASHPPLTSDPTLALGIYPALLGNDWWIVAIARWSTELFTFTYMGNFLPSLILVVYLERIWDFINLKRAPPFGG